MIREINKSEIPECVEVICRSFMTVADEFGFTKENAPGITAFATTEERLVYQWEQEQRLMFTYYGCLLRGEKDGMLSDESWNRRGKCEVAKMVWDNSREQSLLCKKKQVTPLLCRCREWCCQRIYCNERNQSLYGRNLCSGCQKEYHRLGIGSKLFQIIEIIYEIGGSKSTK